MSLCNLVTVCFPAACGWKLCVASETGSVADFWLTYSKCFSWSNFSHSVKIFRAISNLLFRFLHLTSPEIKYHITPRTGWLSRFAVYTFACKQHEAHWDKSSNIPPPSPDLISRIAKHKQLMPYLHFCHCQHCCFFLFTSFWQSWHSCSQNETNTTNTQVNAVKWV